jgi:hypothetical protein
VAAYFRPKSYQLGTPIFGSGQSTRDVIISLEADYLSQSDVMLEVANVWRGISKVQYRMNLIRRHRQPVGIRSAALSAEGQS